MRQPVLSRALHVYTPLLLLLSCSVGFTVWIPRERVRGLFWRFLASDNCMYVVRSYLAAFSTIKPLSHSLEKCTLKSLNCDGLELSTSLLRVAERSNYLTGYSILYMMCAIFGVAVLSTVQYSPVRDCYCSVHALSVATAGVEVALCGWSLRRQLRKFCHGSR